MGSVLENNKYYCKLQFFLILKNPQIMAPLTNAAKMIQEAEESGKSLLEVSPIDSFLLSTKTK